MMDHSAPMAGPPPPYSEARNAQLETPSPSLAARSPRESLTPSPEPLADRKLPLPTASDAQQSSAQGTLIDASDEPPKNDKDDPPEDAQRARAPLLVSRTNSSIKGHWLVFTDGKHESTEAAADARFETTNSTIGVSVWVADSDWKRPVSLDFKTTNSSIDIVVHTQEKGQPLHISSITSNSRNHVWLPLDFHGLLKMSTSNNSCVLGNSLRRRSVRVPNGPDEKKSHAEWYEIGPPGGPSVAEVRTSNSRVSVGLIGDLDGSSSTGAGGGSGKGSCALM